MTLEYVDHLQCDSVTFSLRIVGVCVPRRISDAVSWKHQCPGLKKKKSRKCCYFFGSVHTCFCIATLCPINVVDHRNEKIIFNGFF